MIYANNAGTSFPKAPGVVEAAAAALAADPEEWPSIYARAHASVCAFLGVSDASRVMLTSGCTAALSTVIGALPWSAGDVVVTSALEHHALASPITRLATLGVEHVAARCAPGAPIVLEDVDKTLRQGNVRLVAVTAASNVTGEILPLAELASLAHAHGALLLVDAAQTVGMVPVDVMECGADLFTFAGHKGPLGPQGIGAFWAAPHVSFSGAGAVCVVGDSPGPSCDAMPGFCDVGSVNLAGAAGLAAGLEWLVLDAGGASRVGERPRALIALLVDALDEIEGCRLYGAAEPALGRTATVSLGLSRCPVRQCEAAFRERGIVVRAGEHCAPMALDALGLSAVGGTTRLSLGPFNTREDVDAIAVAVRELSLG